MEHRQESDGQVGGPFSSPGDPGNPVPQDDNESGDDDDADQR
ncbi:hypothetical protein [Streptomyces sp. NPDC018045]